MRITVELRTEAVAESHWLPAQPEQLATLSGAGWSVPVSIRAISANSGEADDKESRRLLGPGYVLDDDAEAWVAVMETYGGELRVASSFLPLIEVQRLITRGLADTARWIEQGDQ